MTQTLKLGSTLTLPIATITQTFAILAKRGVGKTYLASVMAEEMLEARQQVIAVDPTGAWWGLRSHYPVVVFGGEHGDLPLEESAGETVARAVVEGRFPAVLDLSLFRKGQLIRFMVGFAEALYRLNRMAVHLFVDEADTVAPQAKLYGGDENRMLGAMEDIVRRGRKRGIGCTLITQRPQVLNKNVLTQCEALFAMRLMHPKDIDAIEEWVNVHGDPRTAERMISELPSLPVGEAWFWAPAWDNAFRRVKVRSRKTFDSGATPKPGEQAKTPPRMAKVDLAALGERIKAAAETAKANDPRELKRRIAELEREVGRTAQPALAAPVEKIIERAVLKDGQMERAEKLIARFEAMAEQVREACRPIADAIALARAPSQRQEPQRAAIPSAPRHPPIDRDTRTVNGAALPKAQRLILTVLAQHGRCTKSKIAILAGYAVNGGGFNNALSWLRAHGYLQGAGESLEATPAGIATLGPVDPLPSGKALIEKWKRELPKAESLILDALCTAYPRELEKEDLAAATGYEASGGGFNNALSRLRTLELIEGRGAIRASSELGI